MEGALLGYSAAILSAVAWAGGSILFRKVGERVSPIGMNLGKCAAGAAYVGIILLIKGAGPIDTVSFLVLGFSGLLGIALGDTFFFQALVSLGPKLTVLLGTLGPVFTVLIAIIFLNERITLLSWIGILLTLSGVNLVVWKRSPEERVQKQWTSGILYGILSVVCLSLGIIMTKVGVKRVDPMDALFIRITWAGGGLLLLGVARGRLGEWMNPFRDTALLRFMLLTVVVVIFGGFYLFIVSLKYIDASIATVLNITDPIFILPMAAILLKERVTLIEIAGAFLAVFGVVLILTG